MITIEIKPNIPLGTSRCRSYRRNNQRDVARLRCLLLILLSFLFSAINVRHASDACFRRNVYSQFLFIGIFVSLQQFLRIYTSPLLSCCAEKFAHCCRKCSSYFWWPLRIKLCQSFANTWINIGKLQLYIIALAIFVTVSKAMIRPELWRCFLPEERNKIKGRNRSDNKKKIKMIMGDIMSICHGLQYPIIK